ncbi:Sucrose-phosphate synthase family protein [Trifolium repens]|nr:Sucrose-phosphate synthase family protein [Trifolium repens]
MTLLRSHRDDIKGLAIMSCHRYPVESCRVFERTTTSKLQTALTSSKEDDNYEAVKANGNGTDASNVMCFFTNPHKPMILALSRPDPKKNITTLLKAFGECRSLRELANLMSFGSGSALSTVLKLIHKYDLYGHVVYPKHHKQSDVPEIYRFAAITKVLLNYSLSFTRQQ